MTGLLTTAAFLLGALAGLLTVWPQLFLDFAQRSLLEVSFTASTISALP